MKKPDQIKKIVDSMSLDELCGQVLNLDMACPDFPISDFEKICAEIHPGSIFVDASGSVCREMTDGEKNRYLTGIANRYSPAPVIVVTDGQVKEIKDNFNQMAWGATDDPILMEKFSVAYAEILRKNGIHVLLGPVVDINYNMNSPIANVRSFSDDADHVIKIGGAYVKGLTAENKVIACCKHFPGDGTDDRNQHFCTTINSKSRQEWMDTYGRVYKEMFKNGAKSVMCAHIALPSWQSEEEYNPVTGYLPCSISKMLMTDLLKGELGFEGCIISDAMNMIGAVSACEREKLGVKFIQAGGDLMLFAHPQDFYSIRNAVTTGEIPMERLKDAVTRILIMKNTVNLLDESEPENESSDYSYDIDSLIREAVTKSFKIERNVDGVLPLKLKEGDRILMVNMMPERQDFHDVHFFDPLKEALEQRGFVVDEKYTPFCHLEMADICKQYDCVLVNSAYSPTVSNGGTLRVGSDHMGPFWDGLGLQHPKLIYTSFGDPYKLYEHPFLHHYINCFSSGIYSQQHFVKVLLGEASALGKNPVELQGFFNREI